MEIYLKRIKTRNHNHNLVVAPAGYPGKLYSKRYVYEHRAIWWLHYGSLPPEGWNIHHKNGNPQDNRIENLEALTASEHSKDRHNGGKEKAKYNELTCAKCGISFLQLARTVKYRKSIGQINFYCSKEHQIHPISQSWRSQLAFSKS